MVQRTRVIRIVEDALPFAEIAQHLGSGFSLFFVVVVCVSAALGARLRHLLLPQNKLLVLEQQHPHDGYVHRIADAGVLVDQRHLQQSPQLCQDFDLLGLSFNLT